MRTATATHPVPRRAISFVVVLGLFAGLLAVAGSSVGASTFDGGGVDNTQTKVDHCPGANEGGAPDLPNGYESGTKTEANSGNQATINAYVPPAGTELCIKSGGQDGKATGIFTVPSGSTWTLQQWLLYFGIADGSGLQGRDVSYYMVYERDDFPLAGTLSVSKTVDTAVYDREVTWEHTKFVNGDKTSESFSGAPGDTFNWTWDLTWTKYDSGPQNHRVSGSILVTNGVNLPMDLSTLTDQLLDALDATTDTATIECGDPAVPYANQQLAAGATLSCSYSVTGADPDATQNRVDVAGSATIPAGYANAGDVEPYSDFDVVPFTYEELLTGSDSAQLVDEYLDIDQTVTATGSTSVPDSYTCPAAGTSDYVNGVHTKTIVNESSLTPTSGTAIDRSANVNITCTEQWKDETATGNGTRWPGTSNWFMYTGPVPSDGQLAVDLIAGQHYDAGDVTIARNGTATITITLHDGFRFANVAENVKIQPLSSAPTRYQQPGSFSVKRTATGSSITITGLQSTAYYGIHVDVERLVT